MSASLMFNMLIRYLIMVKIKHLFLAAVVSLPLQVAYASPSLCSDHEDVIISCSVYGHKIVSICGDAGKKSLVYRYGRANKVELQYPTGDEPGQIALAYNPSNVDYIFYFKHKDYGYSVSVIPSPEKNKYFVETTTALLQGLYFPDGQTHGSFDHACDIEGAAVHIDVLKSKYADLPSVKAIHSFDDYDRWSKQFYAH